MQRIEVFLGDELAASFYPDRGPAYYGAAGQRVRALVNADHWSYDPWISHGGYGGLRYESPTALLASIAAAVHKHGYTVTPIGFVFPEGKPGTVY